VNENNEHVRRPEVQQNQEIQVGPARLLRYSTPP
jgi:hypothetical protein